MKYVFVMSTGRSGTHYLYRLCRYNLSNAVCRHEPYFAPANANMFGGAIHAHFRNDLSSLRRLLEKKRSYIEQLHCSTYVETSHAFLKSYYELAPEYFDDIGLFYLVRDPIKTALSEANREQWLHRFRFPWRNYRAPNGRTYFRWSLTGREPIYEAFDGLPLTLFQHYFIQWIEIQNRAVQFLDRFQKHDDCVMLDSPQELNDPGRLQLAFDHLGLTRRFPQVRLTGGRNRTPGVPTVVTPEVQDQVDETLDRLPKRYLKVFELPRFSRFAWTQRLLRKSTAAEALGVSISCSSGQES